MVYPLVLEIKEREHLDWIHDFTDAFDVDKYIYIDSCHVNGRGNQIIAQKISGLLHRQLQDNIASGRLSIACVTSSE